MDECDRSLIDFHIAMTKFSDHLRGGMWIMKNAQVLAEYLQAHDSESLRFEVEEMESDHTMAQIKVYDANNNFLGYF